MEGLGLRYLMGQGFHLPADPRHARAPFRLSISFKKKTGFAVFFHFIPTKTPQACFTKIK